ncbi:MBL fold metallo-hydrolase [Amorphoplanes nipponensis]|uniref:MBL fold metallo-hydrolase n=1 Tax=Actinoplanes nipponensis TaxID=135950 RepID=A0A919JD79_9ACTN|nr:MBL fold metallo-hydrolase [Actinoplanes nipponensis]GIE47026.1 MBL fold metallo-hydrolase [Actinoplanes nipponensis]
MTSEDERLIPLVDEGLGNSAYLYDVGDGRALVVDPPRDLRALRTAAARRGLAVAWVADTHLHADFLSGAVQLAATDGAQILASAAGMREFDHRGLTDGDEVDLGGLTLRALATPGHTDEHLSFVLLDAAAPVGVFTGGSLIVGAAARTDLLGDDRTGELARAQYASLHRLALLPDSTAVWPTHGAGSFCSAPPGTARTSTIGAQKASNPLLAAPDADTFVTRLVASLGSYPAYFRWLAEANRRGPAVLDGAPAVPALSADEARRLLAAGAVVVDVRPVTDVATGHIPGAIAIPLRAQFATWLGWLVAPDTPVVIVRNPGQDPADVLWPALNIGFDRIAGELAGGMSAWTGEVITTRLVRPDQVDAPVLDIRQDSEYGAGHLPGAIHLELGDLPDAAHAAPTGPAVLMCGHGERAMTAATLLERTGRRDVSVLVGGPDDWATATGHQLKRSA